MRPILAVVAFTFAAPVFGQTPNWEATFREAALGAAPVGHHRGTVLAAEGPFPRVKARLQGVMWKGKTFHGDGTFTNRWLGGVRAGTASTTEEPSWIDGQPSLVVNYPPTALVFRNTRDELRQVSPGVWLGRTFDTRTGGPMNWFLLEAR
jgi:hypothetical protein